jgi:cytochrome oxidase Cu insertion factor (SCO1/SenC/PrrC family)
MVDHTPRSFLLDQEGRLHTVYAHGVPPATINVDIRALLPQ